MKRIILPLFLLSWLLGAADDKPKPIPTLTAEQQRDYALAQLAYARAIAALDSGLTAAQKQLVQDVGNADQRLQQQQRALAASCGQTAQLILDQTGAPQCQPKAK